MNAMRGWIPPLPIALGVAASGASWVLLFIAAPQSPASFAALAWVHAVALSWITLIALSILLHAIPEFLDVEWRSAAVARGMTLFFAAGAGALVAGFASADVLTLRWGAAIALGAVVAYACAASEPLARAIGRGGVARAVARAFGATLAFLIVTAALGALFAAALGGGAPPTVLRSMPPAHAILGIVGWLSLLVTGVSARTIGAIAGARSPRVWAHVGSGSALLVGAITGALGFAIGRQSVALAGSVLLLAGMAAYAYDLARVLRGATVAHRPPQILMACAVVWAIVAAALLLGAIAGYRWGAPAVYVALIGWIGSAVIAHVHHIGVRVVLTNVRGEDDETRPQAVLAAPLTWTATAAYQLAALAGAVGLLGMQPDLVRCAACFGFVSFAATVLNLAWAYRRAASLP